MNHFNNLIEPKFFCRICTLLLREPVQLVCGHRYCESCIDDEQNVIIKCIICNEETLRNKIFFDRGMKNDMEKLKINCPICNWNGLFKNYQDHLLKVHSNISIVQNIINKIAFQLQQLDKKYKEYLYNVKVLRATMEKFVSQIPTYKTSIEEQNLPAKIPQQKEDSIISYNGIFVWKIDDIKNRLNGTNPIIVSLPFYTSIDGYKMCVRLHLNGNGIGQSNHISMFLALMRGEYDAILDWPFNFQIIFSLYDLSDQKNHIIESFQSNIKSKSFQRPDNDMNIGSGCSKFIPRSIVEQDNNPYVFDGSIYIKVMVRKNPIPTSILPYVMNIDPALPICIQEELIQKEIEQNNMQTFKLTLTLKSQST